MDKLLILAEFKALADRKKKSNGLVSRLDFAESMIELCENKCKQQKNANPSTFNEFKIKEEVFSVCRIIQTLFPFPDDMISEYILPNVKGRLR